jgi:hypothetical protein
MHCNTLGTLKWSHVFQKNLTAHELLKFIGIKNIPLNKKIPGKALFLDYSEGGGSKLLQNAGAYKPTSNGKMNFLNKFYFLHSTKFKLLHQI